MNYQALSIGVIDSSSDDYQACQNSVQQTLPKEAKEREAKRKQKRRIKNKHSIKCQNMARDRFNTVMQTSGVINKFLSTGLCGRR